MVNREDARTRKATQSPARHEPEAVARREAELDEALAQSFPASDPPAAINSTKIGCARSRE